MLEINKEYTYSQICEIVGWDKKEGNSKKAQTKEIESAYEFYHPINNKTHKEKKSYVFTKKYRDLIKPSVKNNRGGNNTKNIQPMINYVMGYWDQNNMNKYFTMIKWFCEQLGLLDEAMCNIQYKGTTEKEDYCNKNYIANQKLLCDYVSEAKSILNNIFLTALRHMEKKGLIEYKDEYLFTYRLGKRSLGHFETDRLNEIIKANETDICNEMNKTHNISDKLTGRQNLLVIYNKEDLKKEFDDKKVVTLMGDEKAIDICNSALDKNFGFYGENDRCATLINEEHPLLSYHRVISIIGIEEEYNSDVDTNTLGKEICNIIRRKIRKKLFEKSYVNKYTRQTVYTYNTYGCGQDILTIEKILFRYFDVDVIDNSCLDLMGNDYTDYAIEEIVNMPSMSDMVVPF